MDEEKEPFAVQAAKYCLWAPIIGIALSIGIQTLGLRQIPLALALIAPVLYVTGFIMGIVALFGMRKHGRKGILVRSILGLTLNGIIILIFVMLIPVLGRAREAARAHAAQASVKPFSFKAPAGFTDFPEGKQAMPNVLQAYIKGKPDDEQPDIMLFVEDLGGRIQKADLAKAAAGKKDLKLHKEKWQNHDIDVIEILESEGELKVLTYNAQVPLLPKAVQIKVFGLANRKEELQQTLKEALKGVDGTSNW